MDYPPERVGECKATALTVVFSLRVNELILDLLGSLNNFLVSPFCIFRSGALRQGSDKFYSVSFQARLSLFVSLLNPHMMSGSITIIKPPLGATNGSLSNLELSLAVGVIVGSD